MVVSKNTPTGVGKINLREFNDKGRGLIRVTPEKSASHGIRGQSYDKIRRQSSKRVGQG
jgi:hypothetical protein